MPIDYGTPRSTLMAEIIELRKENAELKDAMGYAESFIGQAKEADAEVDKLRAELKRLRAGAPQSAIKNESACT
jgi:hypothetical protein